MQYVVAVLVNFGIDKLISVSPGNRNSSAVTVVCLNISADWYRLLNQLFFYPARLLT